MIDGEMVGSNLYKICTIWYNRENDTYRGGFVKRVFVESSNVKSIGYDISKRILEVEFNDGSIYNYYEVPQLIYKELIEADSHGKYLDKHIKKAGYKYIKIA